MHVGYVRNEIFLPSEFTYGVVVRFRILRAADDGGECWVSIAKLGESL